MNKSRFIFKAAKVSGSAASDLTRYVAKNSLDKKREGDRPRPLFDDSRDDLTFWQARKHLSINGGALPPEDVLHYVLSFEYPTEYENLGNDDRERTAQVRIFLRRALSEAAAKLGIEHWRWAAGVHLNRPHPHVHLLINKHTIERESRELMRVLKLAKPLVSHNQKVDGKAREFDYGTIIKSFAASVDARIHEREISRKKRLENERTPSRLRLESDRILLAKAMLARDEKLRLERKVAVLENSTSRPPEQLTKLTQKFETVRKFSDSLAPHVENLRARYKDNNAPLPLPALSSNELNRMQDAAIEAHDAERIQDLEKIRAQLADERKTPSRDAHEQGRLQAQMREAETDAAFGSWREKRFDRTFHLYRWEVAGQRLSLAGVDARIEKERVKQSFIHVGIAALLPSQRRAAHAEIMRLTELRSELLEHIFTRQLELETGRIKALSTVSALREIDARETQRREAAGNGAGATGKPHPIYTRAELDRMEFRAQAMRDGGLLLEVDEARRAKDARLAPEHRTPVETRSARDAERVNLAEKDLAEDGQLLEVSIRRGRFTPVAARLSDGTIITGSIRQTEVLSRADALIRIFENTPHTAERETAIRRAATNRESEARLTYEASAAYLTAARSIAAEGMRELTRAGKQLPDIGSHAQLSHSHDAQRSLQGDAFGSVEKQSARAAQEVQEQQTRTIDAPTFIR